MFNPLPLLSVNIFFSPPISQMICFIIPPSLLLSFHLSLTPHFLRLSFHHAPVPLNSVLLFPHPFHRLSCGPLPKKKEQCNLCQSPNREEEQASLFCCLLPPSMHFFRVHVLLSLSTSFPPSVLYVDKKMIFSFFPLLCPPPTTSTTTQPPTPAEIDE